MKIKLFSLSAKIAVFSFIISLVFTVVPVQAGKMHSGMASAISKNLDKMVFKYGKSGNNLASISFGIKEKALADAIKDFPKHKPNKKLTLSHYRLDKVKAEDTKFILEIKAHAKYAVNSYMDADIDFEVRFYLELDEAKKKLHFNKIELVNAKLTKGVPGLDVKDILKSAIKKSKKPKDINASKLFAKMNDFGLAFQRFTFENNTMFINTRASKAIPLTPDLDGALKKMQAGDFTALQPFIAKFK